VEEQGIETREDFYVENYVNNPTTAPEDQLLTEILVPTK
jgi:effector-binding domain-containing protein